MAALERSNDARGLAEALQYRLDRDVRRRAAEALGRGSGGAAAGEPVVEALTRAMLEDWCERVRDAAAGALKAITGGSLVEPLARIAIDDWRHERYSSAADALATLGDASIAPALAPALSDEAPGVRGKALALLVKAGPAAVEPLIAALRDPSDSVRLYAVKSLASVADPRTLGPLSTALSDGLRTVRMGAASALAAIGDESAVPALVAALGDPDRDVRTAVAKALDRLGWTPDDDGSRLRYWIAIGQWDRCVGLGAVAVQPLIGLLDEGDWWSRQAAAAALGRTGDGRAIPPLVVTLDSTGRDLRDAAARALEALGWQPESDESAIRYCIVRSDWAGCARFGSKAIEPLLAALSDAGPEAMAGIADALDELGWQPAADEAGAAYRIGRRDWAGCVAIGAAATPPLLRARNTRGQGPAFDAARKAAERAILEIGAAAVPHLIVRLRNSDRAEFDWALRYSAARLLSAIGAPAVAALIDALGDGDWAVRSEAAASLGEIGDPRAVDPLIATLADESVRPKAVEALERIAESNEGDEPLRSRVRQAVREANQAGRVEPLVAALRGPDPGAREEAAAALVRLGDRATKPVIRALGDRNRDVRIAAAQILGDIGPDETDALEAALDDEDEYVRLAADEALAQIAEAAIGYCPEEDG